MEQQKIGLQCKIKKSTKKKNDEETKLLAVNTLFVSKSTNKK